MKDQFNQIQKRTIQYWYSDGLWEIAFAAFSFILALYFFLIHTLPTDSLLSIVLNMGFILAVISSAILCGKFISLMKERLTYPRIGYIAYRRKSEKRRWFSAGLGILVGTVTATLVVLAPQSLDWMPALSGLLFTLVFVLLAHRAYVWRFYILAFISLCSGSGLSLAGLGDILGLGFFYAITGLALLISGICVLLIFLRQTSASKEKPNDE